MNIMGKRKIMITFSIIIILIGLFSIIFHKGVRYGIDFAGGSNLIIKINQPVTIELLEKLRAEFAKENINANLQVFGDVGNTDKLKISTLATTLTSNKIYEILDKVFAKNNATAGGLDINALRSKSQIIDVLKKVFLTNTIKTISENRPFANTEQLLEKLKIYNLSNEEISANFILVEPAINEPRKNINNASVEILEKVFLDLYSSGKFNNYFSEIADNIIKYIDAQGGLLRSIEELKPVLKLEEKLFETLKSNFTIGSYIIETNNMVGPSIGADYRRAGLLAIIFSVIGMLIYIAWRFEIEYGVGAVTALIHDVLITIGIFSLLDKEFNTQILAALLTIIGYSLNDTIIIYDRIRENSKRM
ncbi:MAG TPA: hypothetical protein PLM75_07905, partial [bacterium]|nr:hypothetical protein [bacterium]